MKTIKNALLGFLFIALITTKITAQEASAEESSPYYLTVTASHWNPDSDMDFSDWEKTEKEYFDKVTNKNDLIAGSGVYTHYFTPDNSEIFFVTIYKTWEDIEKSNDINNELAIEAWPNEEERKAFFKKQSSYYSTFHSDEIYSSMSFTKPLKTESDKPLIYYIKKNDLSLSGEGSPDKFKEFFEKITLNNSYVKGYYTNRHAWGSNSREFMEVFVFDNFGDIEKSFDENTKLIEKNWPDKEKRKEFFKELNKLFTGKHGDYILQSVPELEKQNFLKY